MKKSIKALVNSELLVWSRESAGITPEEAAHKLRTREERLRDWERGVSHPNVVQLRKLSKVYRRPLAVFYLPRKPADFKPLHDFRKGHGIPKPRLDPKLNFEIRRAVYRREIALSLLQDLGDEPPAFQYKTSRNDDPEKVGQAIRETLLADDEGVFTTISDWNALNLWRAAVEGIGTLVFQATTVSIDEMRGFSIPFGTIPRSRPNALNRC